MYVVSATNFANVNNNGNCNYNNASNVNGVRPDFVTAHKGYSPPAAMRKERLPSCRHSAANTNHDGPGYDR